MRRYVAETNRVIGDNIRAAVRRLTRAGLPAHTVAHKTTIVIERPAGMTWAKFKALIRSILQPRKGSIIHLARQPAGPSSARTGEINLVFSPDYSGDSWRKC